ncbi:MAG: AmmeMemoRadiSam system protein B [Phycisphaerae bacterium]
MMIREPAVAGRFYSGDREGCRAEVQECLELASQPASRGEPVEGEPRVLGGIVPHAGWMCSGAVAGRVFQTLAERRQPSAVVVFGAIHVGHGPQASLFGSGAWETPLGLAEVDERLANRLYGHTGLMEKDPHAHDREHSIEVEVPFIQHLMPDSMIVPIMVPPNDKAAALGTAVGSACRGYGADVLFIGSTDLTHYGPRYGFIPEGVGAGGLEWARDVNDRRMIDAIRAMRDSEVVDEARANQNACGAGAIAATLAACKACGALRATLLEHTTSFEVLRERFPEPASDAVGYAGILIG